jgi:hypothetical protein
MKLNLLKIFKSPEIIILLFLIFALSASEVLGGAWPQKKGSGYYKMSFRYLSGDNIYNSDGVKIPIAKFNDFTIGAFGAFGITEKLTGFLNVTLFKSTTLDSASQDAGFDTDVSGFGDIDIGVKYGLLKFDKTVISGKLLFGIPTGKGTPDGGLLTGDGEFNQAIGIEAGHSFWPVKVYLTEGIFFNNRTNGFSDDFRYFIESGVNISNNVSLIVRLHGLISFNNGDPKVKGGFGIYSNNQQYLAYNAELVYKINTNWGISAYYESGTNGKNIISAPIINVGVFITN